jgi:hypothetical protein
LKHSSEALHPSLLSLPAKARWAQKSKEGKKKKEGTHVREKSAVDGIEIRDNEKGGLDDLELYVDALRLENAAVHRFSDGEVGDGGEDDEMVGTNRLGG